EYIKSSLNQGIDPPIVVQIIDQNQILVQYKFQAENAMDQLNNAREKWGPGHPIVKQAEAQAQRAEQKAKDYEAQVAAKARNAVLDSATQEKDTLEQNVHKITNEIEARTGELGDVA